MNDEIRGHGRFDDDPATAFPELAAVLGSDAVWDGPPADLEDRIVAEIGELAGHARPSVGDVPPVRQEGRTGHRERRWLVAVAAAIVAITGVGAAISLRGDDQPAGEVFALEATELATAATGDVELTELRNGLRIVLVVNDLPPAPEGQFYEAWMSAPHGGVSAGTFHMRDGSGRIELWSGVIRDDDYQRFAVTLEDEDGDATSSGRVVLVADLGQPGSP